jgi:hypothetical protein
MDTVFPQLGEIVGGNQVLFSAAKPVFVSYGFDVFSVRVWATAHWTYTRNIEVVFDGLLLILSLALMLPLFLSSFCLINQIVSLFRP